MAKLSVEAVTGEGVFYSQEDVDFVSVPTAEGQIGVLPGHAQLISLLSFGELRIQKGGEEEQIVVFGGFIEVTDDKVIILADSAERVSDIDIESAEQARSSAADALANRGEGVDIEEADAAMRRAAVLLRVGRRRSSSRGATPPGGGS